MKRKITTEIKLQVVKNYLSGETTYQAEADHLGVHKDTLKNWVRLYKIYGQNGLVRNAKNTKYSQELKLHVVQDYLTGNYSYFDLCQKYEIKSKSQVKSWVKQYNNPKGLKSTGSGGERIMSKGRKTSYDERIEIIGYCIENNHDYLKTAQKYNVSYQQVYSWIQKYEAQGVEGLKDNRGRSKAPEKMSEIEQLRAENRLLKAENKQREMEVNFLKKLEEIAGRKN